MFVLTIDQRHSRTETDRVPVLLDILREVCATSPPLAGFERTVGDEIQGLFGDAAGAVAAVRAVVREGGWHLGIGIGPIEGVPATVRAGRRWTRLKPRGTSPSGPEATPPSHR